MKRLPIQKGRATLKGGRQPSDQSFMLLKNMTEYLRHRNWTAHERIVNLTSREEGATRQELLVCKVGLSVSGLDSALKRLVTQGILTYQNEQRDRVVGLQGIRHRTRLVRVYRTTDKTQHRRHQPSS